MRVLAIGDFHGTFSKKFEKLIKDEKIDLVVSVGDYAPFHYRKLWFKHCYGKSVELWQVIGKKKYRALVLEDLRRAENVLKKLNKLPIPVYTVLGNVDWPSTDDSMDLPRKVVKSMPNWDSHDNFAKRLVKYKNIKRFDYRHLKFQDFIFIGMRGHSAPGDVKSKAFQKHLKKLQSLFSKFRSEKVIFVSHNMAYNTSLDMISMKNFRSAMKGYYSKKLKKIKRHYGSKMARIMVVRNQPILHIGGHMHEAWGKDKIGKTICLNPGAAHDGQAAIIEISGKSVKVKFIK